MDKGYAEMKYITKMHEINVVVILFSTALLTNAIFLAAATGLVARSSFTITGITAAFVMYKVLKGEYQELNELFKQIYGRR